MEAVTTNIKYNVFSPDGFPIEFNKTYKSFDQAQEALKNWMKRFEMQGFYSSTRGRIYLDELEDFCLIRNVD